MKKEYTTPVIEKIAFNYRDQVVAASSIGGGGGEDSTTTTDQNTPTTTNPSVSDIINGIINIVTDRSPYVNWC